MKTLKKITYCAIILLLTISCKKDDLPAATQEGRNIMAAKINGKSWVQTACWSCIGGGGGLVVIYENSFLNLRGEHYSSKSDNSVIGIIIDNLKLGENTVNGIEIKASFNDYVNNKSYKTPPNSSGKIIITKIDIGKKIISGTFSFKAENENDPNDIITVTDGRFDVTYN